MFFLGRPHARPVTVTLWKELGWRQPPGLAGRSAADHCSSWKRSLPVKTWRGGLSFPLEDEFADGSSYQQGRPSSGEAALPGRGHELGRSRAGVFSWLLGLLQ